MTNHGATKRTRVATFGTYSGNAAHADVTLPAAPWELQRDQSRPRSAGPGECGPAENQRKEPMTDKIESASDERTANNAVRHQYRRLTDAEKAQMQKIKDMGAAFVAKLHEIGGTDPEGNRFASRDLSLANTHAEDAVMRAVRHITA